MTAECAHEEDIVMVAGNNWPPAKWQFLESEEPDVFWDISGSQFYLTVEWVGGSISRNSVDHPTEIVIETDDSTVTWNYTVDMSRLIPLGRIARYDLERRIGSTQQTLITGRVVNQLGINVD